MGRLYTKKKGCFNWKAIWIIAIFFPLSVFSQTTSFQAGGDFFRGNYNAVNFNSRAEIKCDTSKIEWSINPSFRASFLTQEKRLLNRESYLFSSLERRYGKWKMIVFSESENSHIKRIQYRGNLGVGASVKINLFTNASLDLSEAIMPEIISINGVTRTSLRLSTRAKLQVKREWFKLVSVTLVQPAMFSEPHVPRKNNFILRSTTSVEFTVSKNFSTGISYDIFTQTYPVFMNSRVKPTDTQLSFFLKIQRK